MADFAGAVALVMGASGNLGYAVARAFWEAGAHVIAVDRQRERLEENFPELVGAPEHLLGVADALKPDEVAAVIAQAIARFGKIDAMVNAVGGFRAGAPLHETDLDTLDFMFSLNARTLFIVSQAVIPHMLRQGSGKIVGVAARTGLQGGKNSSAYSAAKGAVIRLVESMSAELKTSGINVNCVLPGTIDTPQNRESMPNADYSKWVEPEALADAILFLASDAGRAVHGAALPVYGLS